MDASSKRRLTVDLNRLLQGAAGAGEDVLPFVYDELRELARSHMVHQPQGHTLQPTALVSEAWIRLAQRFGEDASASVESRRQFFALASKAMRSVLVDHARARAADKRGGGRRRVTLTQLGAAAGSELDALDLEDVLVRLEQRDAELAQLVELRVYGGLGNADISALTGMSLRTVERRWRLARAWLKKELSP